MFKGRKMKCQSQLWSPSTFSVSQNLKRENKSHFHDSKTRVLLTHLILRPEVVHPHSSSQFTIPGKIGIWKRWFFVKRGKPEYREKNLLEQRRGPTTSLTKTWSRHWDLKSGHTCGRRLLSPLRQPRPQIYNICYWFLQEG